MSKIWFYLALALIILYPDPQVPFFNPEGNTDYGDGVTQVIFGPIFRYDDYCMWGQFENRLEKGERLQAVGFANLFISVDIRDYCNIDDGVVAERYTIWARVGLRPANSYLPVIGIRASPHSFTYGLLNWWGHPIIGLTIPSNGDPYIAWESSGFCKNPIRSECRFVIRFARPLPSVEAPKPNYQEGYNALWNSRNETGLKFEPLTTRFLRWLLAPGNEPPEGSA